MRRVRDFAQVEKIKTICQDLAKSSLDQMGIDRGGLDRLDQRILRSLTEAFRGQAVGLNTLAAAVGEDPFNLEEQYEPFLLNNGFIQKTPRGRMATRHAYKHIGVPYPDDC